MCHISIFVDIYTFFTPYLSSFHEIPKFRLVSFPTLRVNYCTYSTSLTSPNHLPSLRQKLGQVELCGNSYTYVYYFSLSAKDPVLVPTSMCKLSVVVCVV